MLTYPPKADELDQFCVQGDIKFFQNEFSLAINFYSKTLEYKLNEEFQYRGFTKEEADVYIFHIYGFLNFLDREPKTMCEEDIDPYIKDLPEESKEIAENAIHLLFNLCSKSKRRLL